MAWVTRFGAATTVANPGTWRVLVDGHVTREWAEHHHLNWYRKLIGDTVEDAGGRNSAIDPSGTKPEADAPEP